MNHIIDETFELTYEFSIEIADALDKKVAELRAHNPGPITSPAQLTEARAQYRAAALEKLSKKIRGKFIRVSLRSKE